VKRSVREGGISKGWGTPPDKESSDKGGGLGPYSPGEGKGGDLILVGKGGAMAISLGYLSSGNHT